MPPGTEASNEKFPLKAVQEAGHGAIWHGQKSWNGVAILAKGADPLETRRGLPGDPDDSHSRYLEATVEGILIGCLYLPNGNPAPGPRFEYKLRWFERFIEHAEGLLAQNIPVVLAGDYNVMPTELDVYEPEKWWMMPCSGRRSGSASAGWWRKAGPIWTRGTSRHQQPSSRSSLIGN